MAALSAAVGNGICAQEIIIPERWQKSLMYVKPIFTEDTLTIRILGDVMMHTNQISNARKSGPEYDFSSYFSLIEDDLKEADLAIANMEFTLGGEPYSGYPCFSAPDPFADYLCDCGFDIFLAANNHIFDKGAKGAQRTIAIYRELEKKRGIRFTGIADNDEEQERNNPLMVSSSGIRLAILNLTYGTNVGLKSHWPKTNRLSARQQVAEALSEAEEKDADVTLVLPHWGTEYILEHSASQENTARWLAENGADIIIGAHPHVIQDFQVICLNEDYGRKEVPVAYSLGNAVSNMSARNTQLELMATVRITRKGNGDIEIAPLEFSYLWCSRPGGYNDSYIVIPVAGFIGKRDEWKNVSDYDKMMDTYRNVSETTGIKDIDIPK
jgi:poly-gamma-glutamate synthesis protein (capsule biosynthesis protein)